jgi:hypothetical protein
MWLLEIATSTEYVSLMVLSSRTMYRLLLWTVQSVGFLVDKMTLGEVVFRLVELSAATIAPGIFHTNLHPQSSASQNKATRRNLVSFQQNPEIECNKRTGVYRCFPQASKDQHKINCVI